MLTSIRKNEGAVIWRPEGELDDPGALQTELEGFNDSGFSTLILDLLDKEWLSSSEIGVVMWLYKELVSSGSELRMVVTSQFVMKTIKLTGVDQLVLIYASVEEALNH